VRQFVPDLDKSRCRPLVNEARELLRIGEAMFALWSVNSFCPGVCRDAVFWIDFENVHEWLSPFVSTVCCFGS
jgi:hypothetical protein